MKRLKFEAVVFLVVFTVIIIGIINSINYNVQAGRTAYVWGSIVLLYGTIGIMKAWIESN